MSAVSPVDERHAMRYCFVQATDRGRVREQNEDTVAIDAPSGLAIVADGMGGYNAGEVASGLAADFLVTHLVDDLRQLRSGKLKSGRFDGSPARVLHSLLRARIDGANEAIIDLASREPACQGMGTTLALLLFSTDTVTTLHLGDSRVYRMRDGALSLLTRDHSLLQEQIDAGVLTANEARDSLNRNFVTRALGVDLIAEPEINDYELMPGDLYLVCSDGLPDMLTDEEIYDLLRVDDADGDASADALDGAARDGLDRATHDASTVESGESTAGAAKAAAQGAQTTAGRAAGAAGPSPRHDGLAVPSDEDDDRPLDTRVARPMALDRVASRLIEAANARGGRDNVSVVLASAGWARNAGNQNNAVPDDRRLGDRRSA